MTAAQPTSGRGRETEAHTADLPLWPGLGIKRWRRPWAVDVSSGRFWGVALAPHLHASGLAQPGSVASGSAVKDARGSPLVVSVDESRAFPQGYTAWRADPAAAQGRAPSEASAATGTRRHLWTLHPPRLHSDTGALVPPRTGPAPRSSAAWLSTWLPVSSHDGQSGWLPAVYSASLRSRGTAAPRLPPDSLIRLHAPQTP